MSEYQIDMTTSWSTEVHGELRRARVRQVACVPDAGLAELIRLCEADEGMRVITLTSEQEGVAMLAGGWLGGERGVLLMQSSGVGNCINMLALQQECRIPLLAIVTMRGEWGEFNPWQLPMGQSAQAALETAGVIVQRAADAADIAAVVAAAARIVFDTSRAVAVLIPQRVLGTKEFRK